MKRSFYALTAAVLLAGCCAGCGKAETPQMEPQVAQMQSICELATMDCYYHNVAKYFEEDAGGFLLWEKDKKFWIEYSGIVRLGVDASQVKIEIDGTDVTITMPDAQVLSSKVDETSLTEESYIVDKDSADVTAEDQTQAFAEAQRQLEEEARSDTALLTEARQRAMSLLEDYVHNIGNEMDIEYTVHWIDAPADGQPERDTAAESASENAGE